MMMRKTLSLLASSCVMAAASVCFGGDSGPIKVLEFNPSTEVLQGETLNGIVADFLRTPGTVHVLGPPGTNLPPGPCRHLLNRWNHEVKEGEANRHVFTRLIQKMAHHQCNVEIVISEQSPTSGAMPEIVSIRPH